MSGRGPSAHIYHPEWEARHRPLTEKEREICGLVILGLRNAQIAAIIGTTEDYVKKILTDKIYPKVKVSDSDNTPKRLALANWWVRQLADVGSQ